MFEIKLLPTPTQQENLVLTDSQPWFLLVVQIPYDSFELRKSTCFFFVWGPSPVIGYLCISISTLQALSHAKHPSWKSESFSNPTAPESPRARRPRLRPQLACTVRAHPGIFGSKNQLSSLQVLPRFIILKWEVLYLLGTSSQYSLHFK